MNMDKVVGCAEVSCKHDTSLTCTASVFCIGGGYIMGGGVTWGLMGSVFASDSDDLGGWSGWQLILAFGHVSGSVSAFSGGSPISANSDGQSGSVSAGVSNKGGVALVRCYTAYLDCSCSCDGKE